MAGASDPVAARRWAACGAALALALAGCSESGAERIFPSPVMLEEVLGVPGVRDPRNECVFVILDAEGRPVPHALLRFQWPDAGRVAFQTDGAGSLTMRLCGELEVQGTSLSAESKPEGQDLLAEPYDDSTQPIAEARIALRVRAER